jgi:2-polyprenyl-3-methyl-5-hydroxy-6-metoxy-1,4-benzoquinol methylase
LAIKSYISGLLRKLHLLTLAENTRYSFEKIKYSGTNKKFKKNHPGIVLPPGFFIYETYRLNFEEYYYDGQATAKEIVMAMGTATDLSQAAVKILDWGCGPGRITRHLPPLLPHAGIYGTDYNEKYISWCSSNLQAIQFSLNHIDPPMNYTDSFFDAVIGLSIFTHLSEKNHFAWMEELYRILKPGGAVFITTQGSAYRSKLLPAEQKQFDKGEVVCRENVREGNRLFSAFQPPLFMKQLVANKFQVIAFTPATLDSDEPAQDCWLLKKIG